MTTLDDVRTDARSIEASESWTLTFRNLSSAEQVLIDTITKSCGFVDVEKTGWRGRLAKRGSVEYTVVFKSRIHVNQHKLTLAEKILEETGVEVGST
jgi:hypothetical protein